MNKKYFLFLVFVMFMLGENTYSQSQAQLNQTANTNFKKADSELNKVYKQLLKILEEEEKPLLIKAQKDWLKFRDSHCNFEAEQYEGGSIMPLIYSTCLEECTKNRIKDLKASIKSRNQ